MSEPGVVVIGRNEGERLRVCLESVLGRSAAVVYVDSGSTDGSVELARSLGAEVVALDMSVPFTAARARNAGFERLERAVPDLAFVQFVDGDCEVVDGWLERGAAALRAQERAAIVCGRCRERHPERSIYNRIADIEFDTPIGEAKYCGGNAMARASAFREAGGFNAGLIAGEEPELCVRLRMRGWTILRIDAEMVLHDMAMVRFGQWWKRSVRSGFAYAEGAALHGGTPERHFAREARSVLTWGLALPLLIAALAWPTRGASLALALAYPLQTFRVARHYHKAGTPRRLAWLYGGACVLSRFPGAVGAARFWQCQLLGQRQAIIEHKAPSSP